MSNNSFNNKDLLSSLFPWGMLALVAVALIILPAASSLVGYEDSGVVQSKSKNRKMGKHATLSRHKKRSAGKLLE